MSLHPFIQIEVDGVDITMTPEFVQSVTYKSSIEALSTLDFSAIDPAYTALEDLLLSSDKNKTPIYARLGYLSDEFQLSSNWVQCRMVNYVPRLTYRGMEITVSCLIDVGNAVVKVAGGTYTGRISSVVQQIADEIGIDTDIEETNDDINDAYPNNRGDPRIWSARGYTSFEFIRKELLPLARSRSGQSNYQFWVTGVGRRSDRPILHFHTIEYPNCTARKKKIKEFTYLAGAQDQVLEFTPNYSSALLGNLGGGQTVMRAYDPRSKKYVSQVQNFRNFPNSAAFGSGDRSVSEPVTEPGTNEDLAGQVGFHQLSESSIEEAEARARNRWELLKAFSYTAELVLVGLPDYPGQSGSGTADIEANDLVKVNVLIPGPTGDPNNPSYRSHWTSGLYLVTEAVHQVADSYTVTCQLRRDLSQAGAAPKKGAEFKATQ